MAQIVALGELLMDCTVSGGKVVASNPGGSPCNYLAAAAKYGASAAFIGKIGDDPHGHVLESTLKRAGVSCAGLVRDINYRTTQAFVRVAENGECFFSFARNPGADMMLIEDEVDFSLIDGCEIFHFAGSLSLTDEPCRGTLIKAAEYAKEKGKLVSFDPNYREYAWNGDLKRARSELLWGCDIADIVKLSERDKNFIGLSVDELLKNSGLVMITKGAKGASLFNAAASVDVECPQVEVVDTIGAGDIFGGAAAAMLLRIGKKLAELQAEDLLEIGHFAVNAASYSTQRAGAIPSIPDESLWMKA